MPRSWLIGLMLVVGWPIAAAAQITPPPDVLYRSPVLERTTGPPDVHRAAFDACDPNGRFRLRFENGVEGGRRVSSGSVRLNGRPVVSERDLNQQVAEIVRPVALGGTNVLEVRLAGAPGGRARVTVDGDMNCLRVRITAPAPGSLLKEPAVLLEGEIESRVPAGVRLRASLTLRGHPFETFLPVESQGGRFAAWVPLAPGSVRLTAMATDRTGRTAEDTVTVTFSPDPPENDRPMRPEVSPTVGFAPLTVTFGGAWSVADPDVDAVDLDVDGDRVPDFTWTVLTPPSGPVTYTYQAEGLYVTTSRIRGKAGAMLVSRMPINVIPRPDLPAIWNGLRAALAAGDVQAALAYVADEARERYRRVFEDLRGDLPAVAATLHDVTPLVVRPRYATGSTTRLRDGAAEAFLVSFVRDHDGIWRIAGM